MQAQTSVGPWWATLAVWGVVNAVNLLQAVGFLSRIRTGSMAINHLLGYVMIALAAPATLALITSGRARAGWLLWLVTVATTVLLLGSMAVAMRKGVG